MIQGKKLIFVDTETTGTDPSRHEVIEIAGITARIEYDLFGKPILTKVAERQWQITPEHIERADPEALRANHFRERDWSGAVPKEQALREFVEFAQGSIFIAQNVTFDWEFLLRECERKNLPLGTSVFYLKLDLASMAIGKYYASGTIEKYTLKGLALSFGVHNKDAHTALSDTQTAFEICKKLLETA